MKRDTHKKHPNSTWVKAEARMLLQQPVYDYWYRSLLSKETYTNEERDTHETSKRQLGAVSSPAFNEKSPTSTTKSPALTQKSHIFKQESPILTQKSPAFCSTTKKSPMSIQKRPVFTQSTQKSPTFPQKALHSPKKHSKVFTS